MSPVEGATVATHDFQQMLLAEFQKAADRGGWSLLLVGGRERTYGEIMEQLSTMAETALARLEERRSNPELPSIHLRIPTRLVFGERE
jgi:hypothetical protein